MSKRNRRATLGDMTVQRKPGGNHYPGGTNYYVMGYRDMPGAVVVGSDIFTVAMSFTEEGRGAILVVTDTQDGGTTIAGLRQRQDGKLEFFGPPAFDVIDVEHPFIREIWGKWVVEKVATEVADEKDNHVGLSFAGH